MLAENIYRWIAVVMVLSGLSVSIYYRLRADRRGGQVSSQAEGRLLLVLRAIFGLGGWLTVFIYLINPAWLAWARLDLPPALRWAGAALMALCLPLFPWIFRTLGNNITPTVVTRQEHRLVTQGPYHWVRHPLYTAGLLFFTGLVLLSANALLAFFLLSGGLVIYSRTPLEEARLRDRFGEEYEQYARQTGRYLPRWSS